MSASEMPYGTDQSEVTPQSDAAAKRTLGVMLVLGIVVALLAGLFFSWLAEEVFAGDLTHVDELVHATVNSFASPALTSVMRAASRFGGPSRLAPVGVVLLIVFLLRRWNRGAVLLAVTMAGAGILDVVLKLGFRRARPEPLFDYPLPSSYSFPSGHALFSFCFFGALAALASRRLHHRWARVLVWIVAAALVLLIGVSRIYFNVHHATDVAAGFAVGCVWVMVVAVGDYIAHQIKHRRALRRAA